MNTVTSSTLDEAATVVLSMLNGRRKKRNMEKAGDSWDSVLSAWRSALHLCTVAQMYAHYGTSSF